MRARNKPNPAVTNACLAHIEADLQHSTQSHALTLLLRTDDAAVTITTPKTRREADAYPEIWGPAIKKELDACQRNQVWHVLPLDELPPGRRLRFRRRANGRMARAATCSC